VTEIIKPADGDPVRLQPCPSWCTLDEHLVGATYIAAEDGFFHEGPEVTVSTTYRELRDRPLSVVRLTVKSWVSRLDGDPGPARIELELGTAGQHTDQYVELTPDQARMLAVALNGIADIASCPETTSHTDDDG
jgi:hypothetical protein